MTSRFHQMPSEEVTAVLGSHAAEGLTEPEAERRRQIHGLNQIEQTGTPPWSRMLLEQFEGRLVQLLIGAAAFSFLIGEALEAGVILALVILNAALGFTQEYRAGKALDALRKMTVSTARVCRDGHIREIPAHELVPGDVVLLQAGNLVPADGRLLQSVNLRVQESALTGETAPVDKEPDCVLEAETPLGDRRNMVHMGTLAVFGHGSFIVTETGMATALGQTAKLLKTVVEEPTPLQKQLDAFAATLSVGVTGIAVIVLLLGRMQGADLKTAILTAISLAVAAVPEALTAVVTITLALGAQKLLRQNVLVRKLSAVEAMGSVRVICADKTGTLTQNRMIVAVLDVANHRRDFRIAPGHAAPVAVSVDLPPAIRLLLLGGALCNDTVVEKEEGTDELRVLGEPTEAALALAAGRLGRIKGELENDYPRVAEIPFDSRARRMITLHRMPVEHGAWPEGLAGPVGQGGGGAGHPSYLVVAKGALEAILGSCTGAWVNEAFQPLDETWRQRIQTAHDAMAAEGMRVLAVAIRLLPNPPSPEDHKPLETELTFVGLTGIYDPPRPEVRESVDFCRRTGIRPVMITGDHPLTARRIADEVGIAAENGVVTGPELERLNPDNLVRTVEKASVFARVSPEHKLKLIEAYQRLGWTVAMTGDGVNDAPALKKADIGIAMGRIGTDVAKESAQLVLLDDNFATITAAVKEGRTIYGNLAKFVLYLLSCNVSEIAVVTFAPFLGMPLPLLPLQILWMNLVTDGLPALALGIEPPERSELEHRPSHDVEPILGPAGLHMILLIGLLLTTVSLGLGFLYWAVGQSSWQTMLLTELVFGQMAVALALRSRTRPVAELGWFGNPALLGSIAITLILQVALIYAPPLQAAFHMTALSGLDFMIAVAASVMIFLGAERVKKAGRRIGALSAV